MSKKRELPILFATNFFDIFTIKNALSPNTTSLEIAFKVTDMLSIENPNADYLQAYLDGFEIAIEAN